jgi:acetate kinase
MDKLGIRIDTEHNDRAAGAESEISTQDSPTQVWVIPTNEELLLARDTLRCILGIPHL